MKNRKLKYLLIIFLLIIGCVALTYSILARDEPPHDDSDLRLSAVEIPEDENAFYPLNRAAEKLYWPEEKGDLIEEILFRGKWDAGFVEDLLRKNKETLY